MAKPRKLTHKQRAFAIEYPKDFNATQAAIRAGYSKKTARQAGYKNMMKVDILQKIEHEYKSRVISADEVLFRLVAIAKGEKPSRITVKDGEIIQVFDRKAALELLGKYHALFTERIVVEDWRTKIIQLLRDGVVDPEDVTKELGEDLANELFVSAGIPIAPRPTGWENDS